VVYISFKSILLSFPFKNTPNHPIASKPSMPDPPWSFFNYPDTSDLSLSWPPAVPAPEMEGTGTNEANFYLYMVDTAAEPLHGVQMGDFQPPPADLPTSMGGMPAAEEVESPVSDTFAVHAPSSQAAHILPPGATTALTDPALLSFLQSQATHTLVSLLPSPTTQLLVSSPINPHDQGALILISSSFFLKPQERQVKCLLGAIYRPLTFQLAPLWVRLAVVWVL
jgi:hypothetical protein